MEIRKEAHNLDLCCHTPSFAAEHHFFHWHENFEICRVEATPCSFRIDGKLFKAEAGDIVVIPPHTVHQFIIESDDTEITILQFPLKVLLNFGRNFNHLQYHISAADLDANFTKKVDMLFSLLLQEHAATLADSNLYFASLAVSLYSLLQSKFSTVSKRTTKHRDEFFSMVEYINNHYKEDLNLNSLSSALYMSRNKVSDLFKTYAGISVNDYINALRIRSANSLLKDGISISDAAFSSGFSCIRTFNNVYKNITGLSPTEFLNK